MLLKCLAVGLGGFIGAIGRYLFSAVEIKWGGNLPINTLVVNLVGAIIIGFVIAYAQNTGMSEEKLLFLKVGLCGGLTTFSTFSVETFNLIEAGSYGYAICYVMLSVVLCVLGVALGMKLA